MRYKSITYSTLGLNNNIIATTTTPDAINTGSGFSGINTIKDKTMHFQNYCRAIVAISTLERRTNSFYDGYFSSVFVQAYILNNKG